MSNAAESANLMEAVVSLAKRKAQELEDYEDRPGDAKAQKLMNEQEEGERIMTKFVEDFKALPLKSMDPDQALQKLKQLKQGVDLSNPFISKILSGTEVSVL